MDRGQRTPNDGPPGDGRGEGAPGGEERGARPAEPEGALDLLRQMLRIRRVEERIEEEYPKDEIVTPVHLCIGQEAVAVGVCAALRKDDYVLSNHRGHGHYLAKGGDLGALLAELYGRRGGCSRGHGGSMHLVDLSVGLLGSSAIVGGSIPLAVGLGLSIRMDRRDVVAAVFFGDGAVDEGVFYESVNFAVLRRLPVLFALENNEWAVCSHVRARQSGPNVFHGHDPSRLATAVVDGNDVLAVRAAAQTAVERARAGQGPSLLECRTYRLRQHVGPGSDAHLGYRGEEEIAAWEARCPIAALSRRLEAEGGLDEAVRRGLEGEIEREIEEALIYARQDRLPEADAVTNHLFRE